MSLPFTCCALCGSDEPQFDARPIVAGRACPACYRAIVLPLRTARLIGRDGADRVAEFALMLARQRGRVSPAPVKEIAHIIAQGITANAVERLYAEGVTNGA
jgi:recombinational DNA repair protein (RecF pathway)